MTLSHDELRELTRLWTAAGQKAAAAAGRPSLSVSDVVHGLWNGGYGLTYDDALRVARDGVNFGYLRIDRVDQSTRGMEVWFGLTPTAELFRRDNP